MHIIRVEMDQLYSRPALFDSHTRTVSGIAPSKESLSCSGAAQRMRGAPRRPPAAKPYHVRVHRKQFGRADAGSQPTISRVSGAE